MRRPTLNDSQQNQPEQQFDKPYQFFEQQITRHVLHFYLNQEIEAPELYTDMIFRIQTAGPEDVIYIHLNTPGGQLHTGVQLVNAMQTTQAHVICSLEGSVASLGTIIFLAGHEWCIHDTSMMMFHNYSGGVFGKGHEQIAALDATTKWVDEMMSKLYIPFMSDSEWQRIRKGEDLYFHAEEIRDRLANMVEILEKEAEEAEKEDDTENSTTESTNNENEAIVVQPKKRAPKKKKTK